MIPLAHVRRTAAAVVRTLFAIVLIMKAGGVAAQGGEEDLPKKLSNPVAALISVPFQGELRRAFRSGRGGARPGRRGSRLERVGDRRHPPEPVLLASQAWPRGVICGVGPVLLLPTGSDSELSQRKWGLRRTAVALRQHGPWTYGVLANHVWSVAGDDDRADVNSTFLQPFLSHTTPTAWTYTLNLESAYDRTGAFASS